MFTQLDYMEKRGSPSGTTFCRQLFPNLFLMIIFRLKGLAIIMDNYLVFYKTDDETEIVYVVRIMYGGRDVHKQLSQTEDVSVN